MVYMTFELKYVGKEQLFNTEVAACCILYFKKQALTECSSCHAVVLCTSDINATSARPIERGIPALFFIFSVLRLLFFCFFFTFLLTQVLGLLAERVASLQIVTDCVCYLWVWALHKNLLPSFLTCFLSLLTNQIKYYNLLISRVYCCDYSVTYQLSVIKHPQVLYQNQAAEGTRKIYPPNSKVWEKLWLSADLKSGHHV